MKKCSACQSEKHLAEFHKSRIGVQGRQSKCKACNKTANAIWYAANKDRVKATTAAWEAANPSRKKATNDAWNKANPEKKRAAAAAWAANNKERRKATNAALYAANPERMKITSAAWDTANPERRKAIGVAWTKAHPEAVNAKKAARKARKLMATPGWANMGAIKLIFAEAVVKSVATGRPHHVDHIVPLRSRFVCGLHVHQNLQIITREWNLRKGNGTWPDMP